jgi:D-alanyl-D-alanine carboxypeptidase
LVAYGGIAAAAARHTATKYSAPVATRYPYGYPLGTTAEITQNGKPFYSVTATHYVNPAKAWLNDTPQNAGDIFVAVEFTIRTTGSLKVSDDILDDTLMYDSSGKSYFGSLDDTAWGPHFKDGTIDVVPGASESGWAMFEVPGNVQVTKITFTPGAGGATTAAVSWSLPYWPRFGCVVAPACHE